VVGVDGKHSNKTTMALKKLRVKMTEAPALKAGETPTLTVEGDIIKQYITADKQKKEA